MQHEQVLKILSFFLENDYEKDTLVKKNSFMFK